MPLLKGEKNIGKNIETEVEHGKSRDQSIAISLHFARDQGIEIPPPHKKKRSEQVAAMRRKMKEEV